MDRIVYRECFDQGSGKSQNEHQPQNLQRVHQVSGFIFRIQNGDTVLLRQGCQMDGKHDHQCDDVLWHYVRELDGYPV